MYYSADGVERDKQRGLAYLNRACEQGLPNACRWLKEYQ
jgi:TPR repeat protein